MQKSIWLLCGNSKKLELWDPKDQKLWLVTCGKSDNNLTSQDLSFCIYKMRLNDDDRKVVVEGSISLSLPIPRVSFSPTKTA